MVVIDTAIETGASLLSCHYTLRTAVAGMGINSYLLADSDGDSRSSVKQ